MARYLYGGGGDGDIIRTTGLPYINATALIYNSRTGGTQITDLQNISGGSVTQVVSDANGQVVFYGPDNYIGVLWMDFGSGVRWALSPKALDLASNRALVVQRTADAATPVFTAKAALPYNTADPLEQALATKLDPLVIPRFASQIARDAAFPAPANGDRCWRTDLKTDQVYDGTAWRPLVPTGDWTLGTYTYTFSTSGTFTLGSGSLGIRYLILGKMAQFYLWVNFGADTTVGVGNMMIENLPFNLAASTVNLHSVAGQVSSSAGRFPCIAQPAGTNSYSLWAPGNTTSPAYVQVRGAAGTAPGAGNWGSGSFIRIAGVAELA